MIRSLSTSLLGLSLLASGLFAPAGAQESPPKTTIVAGEPLSLKEAVATTLRRDPEIERARQVVTQRQGEVRQARGLFDSVFLTDFGFDFIEREILSQRREREVLRRVQLEIAADILDEVSNSLIDRLPTLASLLLDECEPWQSIFIIELSDGTEVTMCMFQNRLQGILRGDFFQLLDDPELARSFGFEDLPLLLLLEQLDEQGFLGEEFREQILRAFSDLIRSLVRQLRLGADALRLQRSRLGDLPTDEQLYSLELDITHQRRFLNGMALSTILALGGTEDHFAGKPHVPAFGDSLVPNLFDVTVGMGLDIPLGKGRGRVATAAPLRAAEARLQASEELLAHTASRRVLQTVVAYWSLASAQDRLRLLEESEATQERVLEATEALVEGDVVIAAELSRTRARLAGVRGQVARARQAVVAARTGLIEAMGTPAALPPAAPLADDPLEGEVGSLGPVETWLEIAQRERRDLAAAEATRKGAEILARGAKANLKREVDLSLQISYGGIHESFDSRIYDLEGYWEAATGRIAGPSYGAALRFSLPFGNRAARGQLIQAEASAARTEITETDLERRIRLAIMETHESIQEARNQLRSLRTTLTELEKTLDASLERFRVGDLNLIDTLTTEQQVTDTRLALVETRRRIAILGTRLRFEAGRLLEIPEGDADVFGAEVLPLAPPD